MKSLHRGPGFSLVPHSGEPVRGTQAAPSRSQAFKRLNEHTFHARSRSAFAACNCARPQGDTSDSVAAIKSRVKTGGR